MGYQYKVKLADIYIHIVSEIAIKSKGKLLRFCASEIERKEDITIYCKVGSPKYTEGLPVSFSGENYSIYTNEEYIVRSRRFSIESELTHTEVVRYKSDPTCYTVWIPEQLQKALPNGLALEEYIALEEILMLHGAFILHSSYISWNGYGICFSAPSGTGKSTQADLWAKYEQAQIMNGDRSIIRRREGEGFYVHGCPYCGSSLFCENQSRPLKALIILGQAKTNQIQRLGPREAFKKIYSETTVNSWNPEFVERIVSEILALVTEVPVYYLACRPDQDAVELVKNTIFP